MQAIPSQKLVAFEAPDLLAELPRHSRKRINRYKKGQVICAPGSIENLSIHVIESGRVILHSVSPTGQRVGLEILGYEDVFGLEALVGPYTILATCAESSETLSWNVEDIQGYRKQSSLLATAIADEVIRRMIYFQQQIENFAILNAPQRLAVFLNYRVASSPKDCDGVSLIPSFTHGLMADFVGTSREVVTHFMSVFQREGYLMYSRRGILLSDPKGLRRFAMEAKLSK